MLGEYVTRPITAVRERASQASIELLNFLKKQQFCRPPTAICLIERTEDNLINFQVVIKKRLRKFELLKCCLKIFQQRSQADFVSNRELVKCCCRTFQQRSQTDFVSNKELIKCCSELRL